MANGNTSEASAGGRATWIYRWSGWALLSCLLAFAAPYGEAMSLDFFGRLGYWASINAMAIMMAVFVRNLVLRWFPSESLAVLIAIAILQALTLGPSIWLVNNYAFGFDISGPVWLAELVMVVLLAALCVALIRYEVGRVRAFAAAEQGSVLLPEIDQNHRPGFLDQPDPPLAGEVLLVSAADHYLDVVTTQAQGRVLLRFRDALIDLETVPGFRIHRSHWVAASELTLVRQEGRRHVAELRSGKSLPVSDAYVEGLRLAGLMEECATGKRIGRGPSTRISARGEKRHASSGRSQSIPPV
ncbi:LytTr DNA-binding domain-containing protein [Roseicyclus mahoneyensis]|uniref:LytTr DNA-binding domain-containing protein n=1 Tax=Roseicyclus mahoneyensis TaxID=164332 RepID=A0A316GFE0_9RHOB|nr:LytTr DNA-binding domain-containing protein [Roseicyclus mahoneyensis]